MGSLSPLSFLWGLLLLQGVLRPLRGDPGVYGSGMACVAQAGNLTLKGPDPGLTLSLRILLGLLCQLELIQPKADLSLFCSHWRMLYDKGCIWSSEPSLAGIKEQPEHGLVQTHFEYGDYTKGTLD